eukprot:364595-Chlamydomonas_euryale.AAC.15
MNKIARTCISLQQQTWQSSVCIGLVACPAVHNDSMRECVLCAHIALEHAMRWKAAPPDDAEHSCQPAAVAARNSWHAHTYVPIPTYTHLEIFCAKSADVSWQAFTILRVVQPSHTHFQPRQWQQAEQVELDL